MIRFYCDQCGKSLRANEEIVGRKIRCTACPAMMTVPPISTRKSGENSLLRKKEEDSAKEMDADSDSLLQPESGQQPQPVAVEQITANGSVLGNSDSFNTFDDFDFSTLKLDASPKSGPRFNADSVLGGRGKQGREQPHSPKAKEPASPQTATPVVPFAIKKSDASAKARTSISLPNFFGNWLNHSRPWPNPSLNKWLIGLAAILLLGIAGYFAANRLIGQRLDAGLAEFENLATVQHYAQVLRDLRKAERVMFMMEEGYLSRKLPESDLQEVRELREQVKQIADHQPALKQAAEVFVAGDEEEAKKIIRAEKNRMTELTAKIEKQNEWLKKRVYNR
jgi:DNA-directed RNA polymerase subunit M/transcription elongation factor TFIIS